MKPEEKSKELIESFIQYTPVEFEYKHAIQCALICVEEIIKLLPCINETPPIHRKSEENYIQFWKYGVKSEIQKL